MYKVREQNSRSPIPSEWRRYRMQFRASAAWADGWTSSGLEKPDFPVNFSTDLFLKTGLKPIYTIVNPSVHSGLYSKHIIRFRNDSTAIQSSL